MNVPKNPRKLPQLFWFWFSGEGLPVTIPVLKTEKHFRWRGLYGVQIGRWFIGAIEGGPGSPWTPPAAPHPDKARTPLIPAPKA